MKFELDCKISFQFVHNKVIQQKRANEELSQTEGTHKQETLAFTFECFIIRDFPLTERGAIQRNFQSHHV